ncbi:MAG: matrixin family metalloprotease [Gemmatimonadales bacterium]
MSRVLLFLLLGLVGLVVVERLSGEAETGSLAPPEAATPVPEPVAAGTPQRIAPSAAPAPAPRPAPSEPTGPVDDEPERTLDAPFVEGAPAGSGPSRTPTIERMARLESRRRLFQSARDTYIDSLLVTVDSVVRRWPARRQPLSVFATMPDSLRGQTARAHRAVELAMGRWAALSLGVTFRWATDSADADIRVSWITKFESDRSGQAEILFDHRGVIRHATVTLAFRDPRGAPLNDEELGIVATHELGHALGLPHSSRSSDIMFPTSSATAISRRDRATAVLMYSLVPGSLRLP